jgi:hypothetical protein
MLTSSVNRDQYHQKKELHLSGNSQISKPEKKDFWIQIPSQHLYFFADKILNMNLSYATEKLASVAVEQFLAEELAPLIKDVGKLKVSVKEGPTPPVDAKRE